jgi:hypothetical protein
MTGNGQIGALFDAAGAIHQSTSSRNT